MKTNKDYLDIYNKKQSGEAAKEAAEREERVKKLIQTGRAFEEIHKIEAVFDEGDLSITVEKPVDLNEAEWDYIATKIQAEFKERGFSVSSYEGRVFISINFDEKKETKRNWKQKISNLFSFKHNPIKAYQIKYNEIISKKDYK